jgi:hypothetical protein
MLFSKSPLNTNTSVTLLFTVTHTENAIGSHGLPKDLRIQKMSIAKPEVEFLGIIWRQGKLHIPSARIQAFKNVPIPKNPKKVKSFVCAMSYYRKFIPKFAELAKPLMDFTLLSLSGYRFISNLSTI